MSVVAHAMAAAMFILACATFGPAPASADPTVTTSLSEENGYGRIVLTWPGGVPAHTESITSGVAVISFDRPFDIDREEFLRKMPNYVALARQDTDRKSLRLALKFDYWLNARQVENSLYLDLLPRTWAGDPPPLPADVLARLAASAEARKQAAAEAKLIKERGVVDPTAPPPGLAVRVAVHDGVTRLVFDWNQPVLYSLSQQEGAATITFDRTAKVSLAPIRVDPPPYLTTISAMQSEGRLSVMMKLAPGVVVSDFREDLGVVLDLKPVQPGHADAAPAKASEAAPAKAAAPQAHAPQAITPPAATVAKVEPAAAPAAAEKPVVAPADKPKAEAAAAPAPAPQASPTPEAPSGAVPVTVRVANGRADIEFPWAKPVGAAVFQRGDMLWVVFDERAPLDFSKIGPEAQKMFGKPMQVAVDKGTAFAISLTSSRLLLAATEDGTMWRVSLGDTQTSTGRPISLARSWSDTGEGIVTFDLKGARDVIQVRDPVVGDTLMVATARGPAQAVQAQRGLIEFQALQTAQGIAIVRLADDLNVAAAPDAIIVSRHGGLSLSADNDGGAPTAQTGSSFRSPAFVDFAAWRGKGSFIDGRRHYLTQIASAPADRQAAMRLDYGRFLLAYGLGPEALDQFNMALANDSKSDSDPSFRVLRAVGEYMSAQYSKAVADLSTSALALDPYAAVWRGLARAELGAMDDAHKDFTMAEPVIDTLDPALAAKIRVWAADADLAAKDYSGARAQLDRVPANLADRRVQAQALFVQAGILDGLNKVEEASLGYDKAGELGDRQVEVRSRLAKALMLNRAGKLDDGKLIEELDRLRMAWRGDALELKILSKLADLRLARGDVVEALGAMRVASANFPDSDDAHEMGARMPDIFANYFISGGADKLPAVQALAFYYGFQDLTPIGQKGDEVIRHLAEQLVSVDLLPQAEALLHYQIEHRLYGGVAKAQVAARLAGIYLLDQKPQDALTLIRATAQNLLPDTLDRDRRLLEARALGAMKQYDLALDLLSEIGGAQSDELRADVLWEAQRWSDAGQAAEILVDASPANAALTPEMRFEIMRGAIAYSLAADEAGLKRLRDKYGARMASTPDAASFAVVSDPIERTGAAFRELVSRVASVNTMERFVASLNSQAGAQSGQTPPVATN